MEAHGKIKCFSFLIDSLDLSVLNMHIGMHENNIEY